MNFTHIYSSAIRGATLKGLIMTSPRVSFEFFPPNSLTGFFRLWDTVRVLSNLSPEFISITHGTSGKSLELTSETSKIIKNIHEIDVVPHLTWINSTRNQALKNAKAIFKLGITDLLALRGDDRKETNYANLSDIYSDTLEFIKDLRQLTQGKIRVAAYPEKHPNSVDSEQDIEWLKKKFTAGADEAITQFFFEADTFLRFRDNCEKSGIKNKIIPGILPIHNLEKVKIMASLCGANIPNWVSEAFQKAKRDNRSQLLSTVICSEMCQTLMEEGVEDFHFYTMNSSSPTYEVCKALGLRDNISQMERVA